MRSRTAGLCMFRCRYLKQRPPLCPAFQLRPERLCPTEASIQRSGTTATTTFRPCIQPLAVPEPDQHELSENLRTDLLSPDHPRRPTLHIATVFKGGKGRIHSPEILFATLQNRLHHDPAVHLEKHGRLSHRDRRTAESGSLLSGKRPQADTSVLMSDARRSRMASPHTAPTPTHRAFPTLPEALQALRQDAYPDGTDAEKKGGGEMKSGRVRYGLIQINVGFTTDHADL